MTLWELFGAAALLVIIIGGIGVAAYYEGDLFISLLGRKRERSPESGNAFSLGPASARGRRSVKAREHSALFSGHPIREAPDPGSGP